MENNQRSIHAEEEEGIVGKTLAAAAPTAVVMTTADDTLASVIKTVADERSPEEEEEECDENKTSASGDVHSENNNNSKSDCDGVVLQTNEEENEMQNGGCADVNSNNNNNAANDDDDNSSNTCANLPLKELTFAVVEMEVQEDVVQVEVGNGVDAEMDDEDEVNDNNATTREAEEHHDGAAAADASEEANGSDATVETTSSNANEVERTKTETESDVVLRADSILDSSLSIHNIHTEETAAVAAVETIATTEITEQELRIDVNLDDYEYDNGNNRTTTDLDLDFQSDSDSDSEEEDEDDDAEHEPVDKSGEQRSSTSGSLPSVALTMNYPVNEMEVVTNRGGRSGSLSKFLDDADLYRRRSLTSYGDDPLGGGPFSHKTLTLDAFLEMAIDPILEVLDDSDSDVRVWLMQSDTVEAVLKEFVKPPVFSGEPHEEYGYYKNYFICSEIIMKLYTGEEDLYESFSSDSSSGSAAVSAVFGCQDANDLAKWELLYSIFANPSPLDEMQLLFFSKALVRLHDGFCLEDGYVANVLRRFLPRVMPHLYSNTIKYMLTLILQSYESVHPITGRNDAMEIIVPLLAQATRLQVDEPLNPAAVENASHLLVDMLQANQADRLGAFSRREGGVYLSKYFVRDQFGTIRGFESMTHGYHNFLQFMFLEELSKWPLIVQEIYDNALFELQEIQAKKRQDVSGTLNVQIATELLLLCKKYGVDAAEEEATAAASAAAAADTSPLYANPYTDSYPGSPRHSTLDTSMYNLSTLSQSEPLWSNILTVATATAGRFCEFLNSGLPSSVEIALAKHLHALVHINNTELDLELHKGALMQRYLHALETRPSFDMLLIHIVPAIAFVIKDSECSRSRDSWLTLNLFDEVDDASSLPQLIVRAEEDLPALKIYAGLLKDVIDDVLTGKSPSVNNVTLQRLCKRCPPWGSPRYSRRSSSSPKIDHQLQLTPPPPPAAAAQPQQQFDSLPSPCEEPSAATAIPSPAPALANNALPSPVETRPESPEVSTSTSSRGSSFRNSMRSSSSRSSRGSEKRAADTTQPGGEQAEPETSKKSTHYIKQMLQTPVFRGTMRLGSVIKTPEKPHAHDGESDDQSSQASQRGSFGWNTVLKRLRKSFVSAGSGEKGDKKMLQITNEPYVPPTTGHTTQAEVFVVDTSKGEDVTKFVYRDGGVNVIDVPRKLNSDKPDNTVTSGYMYKNKLPETGQRHLWERYYFVLNRQDGSLSYYVSESHAKDRTYLRGTARPISVTEGIPVSVSGQHQAYGFQINTEGHGAFMVVVDSIDTRLSWLSEIVACVSMLSPQQPMKRLSLVGDDSAAAAARLLANGGQSWTKQQLKEIVVEYYKNLFGPSLRFNTPMDVPASFWMEEKIDMVADSCVLSSNLPECVPYWGEFHGYKRLCDFWKIRDETIERSSGRVLRIVVDEDEETAVVMTSTTYRILRNSQTVTEESCDILNMSFGSIISIHCTFDSYRIAEAFKTDGISAS